MALRFSTVLLFHMLHQGFLSLSGDRMEIHLFTTDIASNHRHAINGHRCWLTAHLLTTSPSSLRS